MLIDQCSFCDITGTSRDDKIFDGCKEKNHLIITMLDPAEVSTAGVSASGDNNINNKVSELQLDEFQEQISLELQHLLEEIEANFPGKSFAIESALSVKAQLKIHSITQVFPLIFMGSPSTHKSTILEIVSTLPDCYHSDAFTPKSFVTHSANSKKEDLGKIDLLPRIRHKTLITPELAPLFSGNQDQLIEYFGILTRILDGRGFVSDSGVHGSRGYTGDYSFTWLGAVIDIPHRVWKLLGNLGPKIYFLRLPDDSKNSKNKLEQIKQILKENSYTARLESSKKIVKKFWKLFENWPQQSDSKITWDKENDDEQTLDRIIELAMVLAKLRATLPTWHTKESDSGGASYNFETPIQEDPSRASSALYNLARGHAILYGRNYITRDDLRIVIPVALSSAPRERVDLLRLLIENNGKLNTDEFIVLAQVSRATARKEMEKLHRIGLVEITEENSTTKPIMVVKLKDEFNWFLSTEFRSHWNEFKKSLTPNNSKLSHANNKDNLEKDELSGDREGLVPDTSSLDTYKEVQS